MKNFENVKFKGKFRDYQDRVLNNADKYLLNGKIHIVAAPGSGKTILGLELIRKLNAPTIILSPTTTIKYQWGDRFRECFLPSNENIDDYFSYDLHEITLINSITYQALHSIMNKISVEEDGEVIDYSNLDIFELIKRHNVKTICLDEAHHLQNEWQKSLEKFIEKLGNDIKIIALTATPPYDAKKTEWDRYEKLCGPIDEEIFVPELVKEQTLCPHQDFIYFNYPTKEETAIFKEYKENVLKAINELRNLKIYDKVNSYINMLYETEDDTLYENVKPIIANLIILKSLNYELNKKMINKLTINHSLPEPNISYYEIAYQYLLNADILDEEEKSTILKILKKYAVLEKGLINFSLKESFKRSLICSLGKLNSIVEITKHESDNLGDNLRLLILTDYIKKENLNIVFTNNKPMNISVVTIFESLAKANPNYKMGVLSGNLVILPTYCKEYLNDYETKIHQIKDSGYSEFNCSKIKNKEKVDIASKLFKEGIINIIIGTKSLLGEGWDSPCINTLILASFVGSFMLSNQMRGRAIRKDNSNPNKVANIWHLATIEPEYIFENNIIKSIYIKSQLDYNEITSLDYDTLVRRFDCFVGPNYETGEIESGIDRLTIIKPPFNKDGIKKINEKMLELSKKRDYFKSNWEKSLAKNFKLIDEIEVPTTQIIKPFNYLSYVGIALYIALESTISAGIINILTSILISSENYDGTFYRVLFVLLLLIILFVIFGFLFIKSIHYLISHSSPKKNMVHISKALLKTLQEADLISYRASVKTTGNDIFIGIHLKNASNLEQNIFNQAINEFFSPIDNPRYILIFEKYNYLDYQNSFACPAILGQKKEMVEAFKNNLLGRIGKFEIFYTRNEEGRKNLIKCKKKSFITINEKMLKRKKKISVFE